MRRAIVPIALALVLVSLPGVAVASHNGAPTIDHYVDADGSGTLVANPGGHTITWERCTPDGSCARFTPAGDQQEVEVRDDPPGTTFRATQDGITRTSEAWRGRLRATAPPRVDGDVLVGGFVRPVAADWEGGWGREADWLQLQVCRTEAGDGCRVVLDETKYGKCAPGGGRLLARRYAGLWLRVVDVRIDRDQPFTAEGYSAPESVRPNAPAPGTVTAAAVVGRVVEGPTLEPIEDCLDGFAQRAFVRSVIVPAERGRLVAADVPCLIGPCRVELRFRQGRRTVVVRRTIPDGSTAIALPRTGARRFRRGRPITLRVVVDGEDRGTRRVRLGAG